MALTCDVCFRRCRLEEGGVGFCGARENRSGVIVPRFYGLLSSIALDPIEKKPLARFFPGSRILSVGSFGCSMACPFCQNHEIARPEGICASGASPRGEAVSPEELAAAALRLKSRGNIGVAYTYNEMSTSWEYVRDTAKLVRAEGMKNVLVTNGNVRADVLEAFLPYIDAMNIDLKSFSEKTYREVLSGDLPTVKEFIRAAAESGHCHVELTTLIVPGMNDTEEEMQKTCGWIASLGNGAGREIPLHVSRFFPRYRMADRKPTPVNTVYHLAEVARKTLKYVYTGNC